MTATVLDQSDRVRSDPQNVMLESVDWNVQISDPSLAQLRFGSMGASATMLGPGQSATYTPVVVNDGPAAAGPFRVEFFLGQNPGGYSVQDTYLGHVDVPGLLANQQISIPFATRMPYSLPLYASWVYAVIDRTNVVGESNELDNEINRVVFSQSTPCTTGLEFQDAWTAPFEATMSLSAGGTLHPTVLAPCADPAATIYLIVWGGSGTMPGTTLSPTVQLPLNIDPLTQATLGGLNGPIFGQFLGVLDAQGRAQATFALPPSSVIPTGTTHFATVLLGATQLFTDASNAISLTIQP